MSSVFVHDVSAVCALGSEMTTLSQNLFAVEQSPMQISDAYGPQAVPLGIVNALPTAVTRNNALVELTLDTLAPSISLCKRRFGSERIGVVVGSSTSGIAEGESAIAHLLKNGALPNDFSYRQQEIAALSSFVAHSLGLNGPAWTVSTACTSGAKAIASGARLLQMGVCDAVVVGGADSLCKLTIAGFTALSAMSDEICNPFSVNRNGINIGEAAALMVLSREPSPVRLAGYGETSDAYHISAPEPEGKGAEAAMRLALQSANLTTQDLDYINLHGTATEQNDRMESLALARVFGSDIPCGSTKALTGHTLGAAGAIEAVFCYLTLARDDGLLPKHLWDGQRDPQLAPLKGLGQRQAPNSVRRAMSNSFAFGGNNISLLLERFGG